MPKLVRLAAVAAAVAVPLAGPVPAGADQGAVVVCNEAQSSFRGVDVVSDQTDPNPPARHKDAAMPVGHPDSAGLINAAAHSPALAVCGEPTGGGGGGDTGGGDTGGGDSGGGDTGGGDSSGGST